MTKPSPGDLLHDLIAKGDRQVELQRAADFCDTRVPAIQGWEKNTVLPRGERLNRLLRYLELRGTPVPRIKPLHPVVAYLARLMAYRVISPLEAGVLLNVNDESYVWRVVQGKIEPYSLRENPENPDDKALTLDKLEADYASVLQDNETEWHKRLGLTAEDTAEPEVEAESSVPAPAAIVRFAPTQLHTPPSQRANARRRPEVEGLIVSAIASHLQPAIPLILALVDDAYSGEAHAALREALGGEDLYFQLTTALNRMSGPRARLQDPAPGEW